jgi:hypothetical protein
MGGVGTITPFLSLWGRRTSSLQLWAWRMVLPFSPMVSEPYFLSDELDTRAGKGQEWT